METNRRAFLKATSLACGAASLPSWVLDAEAAAAAVMARDREPLAEIALARAKKLGATYADIRINRYRNESIFTREERVQSVSRTQSFGFGVRVLLKGAWGFAASHVVTPESVRRVTGQALDIARANSVFQRKPVQMVPAPAIQASWRSAYAKDPFDVAIDDKNQYLLKLNEAAMPQRRVGFVT